MSIPSREIVSNESTLIIISYKSYFSAEGEYADLVIVDHISMFKITMTKCFTRERFLPIGIRITGFAVNAIAQTAELVTVESFEFLEYNSRKTVILKKIESKQDSRMVCLK